MSPSVEAVCVDPARASEVWPLIEPLIARAARHDDLSDLATLKRQACAGELLIWVAWDGSSIHGAALTGLEGVNGRTFCTIVACGGENFEAWGSLIEDIERFARNEECAAVRIIGRKGWLRALKGYQARAVVLERTLNGQ
jgi:hypothetical protein